MRTDPATAVYSNSVEEMLMLADFLEDGCEEGADNIRRMLAVVQATRYSRLGFAYYPLFLNSHSFSNTTVPLFSNRPGCYTVREYMENIHVLHNLR